MFRKPSKKKIKEWLISEIEDEITKEQLELNKLNEDLMFAICDDFKIKIESYKEKNWCVTVSGLNATYTFFIDKKTGKNEYPNEGWGLI